jgi:threonine dehydrogenase-like Zn-dependent dehydrogenase
VGIIHKLGSAVEGFHEGQRVAVNAITPCYQCENRLRGSTSQCQGMLRGWKFANAKDGNLAEFLPVNNARANPAPIPAGLPDELAVYATDLLSNGFPGAERAQIPMGGSVAIFGQGPVGLMATAGARLPGAGLVIAVEAIPRREELARLYGADLVVDFTEHDAVEAILELTGGQGVDSAVEALGAPETFAACVKVTRPGGTISNVGYHGQGQYVPLPRMEWGVGMGGKTVRTALCSGGAERMKRLMRLIENGRIDPAPLTTHRFPFVEIERAFRMMQTKEDGVIKPLILFG